MIEAEFIELVEAAKVRADGESRRGLIEAHRNLANVPEYVRTDDATGKRLLIPARATATGILEYLETAFRTNHPQEDWPCPPAR